MSDTYLEQLNRLRQRIHKERQKFPSGFERLDREHLSTLRWLEDELQRRTEWARLKWRTSK